MRFITDLSKAEHAAMISARKERSALWRLIHRGGSLHLAMILLLTIALACAVATVAESKLNSDVAHYYIYKSPWFLGWLGVLMVNLFCVTLTRWPWRREHLGFVVTHYGIITLLTGAIIGHLCGFEGFVDLEAGQPPIHQVILKDRIAEIEVPRTGQRYELPFPTEVHHPTPAHPWNVPVPGTDSTVRFSAISDKLVTAEKLIASPDPEAGAGIALRFQSAMMSQNLSLVLLQQPAEQRVQDFFGLARIEWADNFAAPLFDGRPTLRIALTEKGQVRYQLFRVGAPYARGILQPDTPVPLGWADWRATLVATAPHAAIKREVVTGDKAFGLDAAPGIQVSVRDDQGLADGPAWILSGEERTFHTRTGTPLLVAFGLKTKPLPFGVQLMKFEVPRDEGTTTPADFISTLHFTDTSGHEKIDEAHMNYPASFPGGFWRSVIGQNYKFSQASWNPQNLNQTTLQILYDPGWPLKWIGSILIVIGITLLFYFRPKAT